MIYIYDDGHHSHGHIQITIHAVADHHEVRFCTASMILNGCLQDTSLLIMPGGADLYNCEKLNGEGNRIIRDYVAQGGSYLGICAGAYYGCSSLDWNHGEIDDPRELGFFHGQAVGPVYEWIENKESIYEGSWIKAVEMKTEAGEVFLTQYNGGPIFIGEPEQIIARYTGLPDQPAAVIGGTFGEGRYILSSPHIEIFGYLLSDRLYNHLNPSYDVEKQEIQKLLKFEKSQKGFFKSIMCDF